MNKNSKKAASPAPAKPGSNNTRLMALLRRESGAALSEITEATGWLPHSARAVLTGLRKEGYAIARAKVDGVTRWSITAEPAA
ncbi:MAG TPA: DUF3489 domain-containing protein [Sphingomicrobium sp.]|nr:DUF3489 domain-containing protein [Sphingomicrobium sp.]